MHQKQEIIIRHYRNGESERKISKDLGISRPTVHKYIVAYESSKLALSSALSSGEELISSDLLDKPKYKSKGRKKRKLFPSIQAKIDEYLLLNSEKRSSGLWKQQMKKIDIYEALQELGYDISYTTVCNYVRAQEGLGKEVYIKQSHQPGKSCEFDWGEVKLLIGDQRRVYQLAVFTSAHSNYRYAYLFHKQDMLSFQTAHVNFFTHIGGVYQELVYDNMKVAVRKFVGRTQKEATTGLLSLSIYYQFNFRFCNVGKGNEKGHVERSVEYIRRKAFSRRDEFDSLECANIYLVQVCNQLNERGQQLQNGKSGMELFKLEEPYLLAAQPALSCYQERLLRVNKYSCVFYESCYYSVPEYLVGQKLEVRFYVDRMVGLWKGQVVCEHKRLFEKNAWQLELTHYLKTFVRKPAALAGSVALKQATMSLQTLYKQYYTETPKDFILLLLYIKEEQITIEQLTTLVDQIAAQSAHLICTDYIKIMHERKTNQAVIKPVSETEIEQQAKAQLKELSNCIDSSQNLQAPHVL